MNQHWIVFFGGTVGNNPWRKPLIALLVKLGYPEAMFYDPSVSPGTWGYSEQQNEDAVAERSALYIYFNGDPMQEGNPLSSYSLQRTGQVLTRYGDRAAAVFDVENMPEGHVRKQLERALVREREFHPDAAIFTNLHDLLGWLLPRLDELHQAYLAEVSLRAKVVRAILMQFVYAQLYYEGSTMMRRDILRKAVARDWSASAPETQSRVGELFEELLSELVNDDLLETTPEYVRALLLPINESELTPAYPLGLMSAHTGGFERLDEHVCAQIEAMVAEVLASEPAVRRYHIGNGESYKTSAGVTLPIGFYSHDTSSQACERLQLKLNSAWAKGNEDIALTLEVKLHPFTPTLYDRY